MAAGALALIGMGVTAANPQIGLTITLVAVYINGKGKREDFADSSKTRSYSENPKNESPRIDQQL